MDNNWIQFEKLELMVGLVDWCCWLCFPLAEKNQTVYSLLVPGTHWLAFLSACQILVFQISSCVLCYHQNFEFREVDPSCFSMTTKRAEIQVTSKDRTRGALQTRKEMLGWSSTIAWKWSKNHFVGPILKSEKCLVLSDLWWSWDPKHTNVIAPRVQGLILSGSLDLFSGILRKPYFTLVELEAPTRFLSVFACQKKTEEPKREGSYLAKTTDLKLSTDKWSSCTWHHWGNKKW